MTETKRRLLVLRAAIQSLRTGGLASQLQPLGMLGDIEMADAVCQEIDELLRLLDGDLELEAEPVLSVSEMSASPELH